MSSPRARGDRAAATRDSTATIAHRPRVRTRAAPASSPAEAGFYRRAITLSASPTHPPQPYKFSAEQHVKEEEEKVRRRTPRPRASRDSRDRPFFFRAPSAARLAPRRARTRALAARLKRNQSGGPGRVLFPSFFRFNPANGRGSLRDAGRIAARNARGEARGPILTLPPTRTSAGGPEPAHHRGRVQPPQAHTQSLQPRRTAVPRVPGYLDSVQKRRLHHGTGAYPARGGCGRARPRGRATRPSRSPARSPRLAARARLRARAHAGNPARVPAIPSPPRTPRSGVNSPAENIPKRAEAPSQPPELACGSAQRAAARADRRSRIHFSAITPGTRFPDFFSFSRESEIATLRAFRGDDRQARKQTDARETSFWFFLSVWFSQPSSQPSSRLPLRR